MNNIAKTSIIASLLISGALFLAPVPAHALLLDALFEDAPNGPHCLLMDCDNNNQNGADYSVNNSYNNNTNSLNTVTQNNSGSGVVSTSPYTITTPYAASTNNNYNYNYTPPAPVYHQPVYVQTQPVYIPTTPVYAYTSPTYYYSSPLSVSCRANTNYTTTGSYVTWTAYPAGGYNGNYTYNTYTYSWSGTDGVYGSGTSMSTYYSNPGTKYAWVTIYSNGQTASAQCGNAVTVAGTYYTQPYAVTYPVYNSGLQVACAAETTSTRIGVPVTWSAEVASNGYQGGNYSYSWSGSSGLYGSNATAIANYSTAGTKTATVTVTAPNGQSASAVCRNTVAVKSAVTAAKPVVKAPVVQTPVPTPPMNPVLTLGNVPWGWVEVLIILVLMGVIFYLIFNKKKLT